MLRNYVLPIGLVVIVLGCNQSQETSSTSSSAGIASIHLLDEMPAAPSSLTDAAESLGAEMKQVTLIGKIDAGDFSAFESDSATFMLSELPADGHGLDDPDHEDNCPFCKRRAANAPKAIVQIVDASGVVVPTNAQMLLGLNQGDRIIAVGEASFDESVNAITVKCEKIYKP